MARIKGVDIPNNKRVEISLTYVYGIGRSLSNKILEAANIDKNRKVAELSEDELNKIVDKTISIYLEAFDNLRNNNFDINP